jgi:LPPG:FO 2-phospho-L-lactate transferase
MITVLSGGVGGARFAAGLAEVAGEKVTIIVNTADDEEFYGLHVSPDLDTVVYTLSGLGDWERGWGIEGDTFRCNEMLGRLGLENWFRIGDADLAMSLFRTLMLRQGYRLTEVVEMARRALGVRARILPMSDDRVRTMVVTESAVLPFQQYFVKLRCEPRVLGVVFDGIERARPTPEVMEALEAAELIVIAPSNPVVSVGPILSLEGVRERLRKSDAKRLAVSPLIGGKTVKGPADKMLAALGIDPTAIGVFKLYSDIIDIMVLDREDSKLAPLIEDSGKRCIVTDTLIRSRQESARLAKTILENVGIT